MRSCADKPEIELDTTPIKRVTFFPEKGIGSTPILIPLSKHVQPLYTIVPYEYTSVRRTFVFGPDANKRICRVVDNARKRLTLPGRVRQRRAPGVVVRYTENYPHNEDHGDLIGYETIVVAGWEMSEADYFRWHTQDYPLFRV